MAIVTQSSMVLDNAKDAPRKIDVEEINDGVKPIAPIYVVIDEKVSKEDKVDVGETHGVILRK